MPLDLKELLGEWYPLVEHVFDEPWMQKLFRRLGAAENVAPPLEYVFRAFKLCPPKKLKVVICLQDPYINGEADGLAMSSYGKMTPSLEIAFAEINRTHACKRTQTHLDDWAEQGVLLMNASLTTQLGKSRAHAGWGWEPFTREILRIIYDKLDQPIVFMLWGKDAQSLISGFKAPKDSYRFYPWKLLKAYHPQAENYNPANKFVGCNHFIEANLFLLKANRSPIWWSDPQYIDPSNGHSSENYSNYMRELLKQIPDVKADLLEELRGDLTVQNKPHPFANRLGQDYTDDLPF